jgi:very-long-chain enoyl-CoA reductase
MRCFLSAAAIFWLAGTLQMVAWAKKKHRNYKKEFGDKYPKDRWAMIPGVL